MNPMESQYFREEIQYLLENNLLNKVKEIGVLFVFLCKKMEHFECALTIEK